MVEGENNKRSWNEVIGARKRGKWDECPDGMVWENVLEGASCSLEERPYLLSVPVNHLLNFVNPLSHM